MVLVANLSKILDTASSVVLIFVRDEIAHAPRVPQTSKA